MASNLIGAQVLVVEDELVIAMTIETELIQVGCRVVGPVPDIDAALLNLRLGDEEVFPLADTLRARGVPFVFVTGHARDVLPPGYRDAPCAAKPFEADELLAVLAETLRRSSDRSVDPARLSASAGEARHGAWRSGGGGRGDRRTVSAVRARPA